MCDVEAQLFSMQCVHYCFPCPLTLSLSTAGDAPKQRHHFFFRFDGEFAVPRLSRNVS